MRLTMTMTSIFIMSDRAALMDTFIIEANQTSKVELYTDKNSLRFQAVKHFRTKFHLQSFD